MLKDELYNIAEQVNIEKEKKRKEYQDELKLRNSSNTNNVWEKYLKKGIIETAQLGDFSRLFRFVKNDRENCYYCVSRQPDTESYFNTKINMPYYYPTIEDSFFDLETLISIIEENGFTYTIKSCPMADSKASKYYTNNAYLRFIIYWGNEVKTTPTTPISSFINSPVFILPRFLGMYGLVWSQFVSDLLTVVISYFYLWRYMKTWEQPAAPA